MPRPLIEFVVRSDRGGEVERVPRLTAGGMNERTASRPSSPGEETRE